MSKFPNIEKIINHVTNNDEKQKEWLMNWLAVRKQTGKKSLVGLGFSSVQGGGQGVFVEFVVKRMFDVRDVYDEIRSPFKSFLGTDADFLAFKGLYDIKWRRSLSDVARFLRLLVTGDEVVWEQKHKPATLIRISANVIIESDEGYDKVLPLINSRCITIFSFGRIDFRALDFKALHDTNESVAFEKYLLEYPIDLEMYDTAVSA